MSGIELEPLSPTIGSLVHGVSLSDPDLGAKFGAQLKRAFLERQVIFFRDQRLDPHALVALARVFGDVKPVASTFPSHRDNSYVEILQSKGQRTGTDVWHADLTWRRDPPIGACLHAVDVPPVGGDTIWASMTAAYDHLDGKLQAYLAQLSAVHDWEGPELLAGIKTGSDAQARYERMRREHPPIEQPMVLSHPETGRKLLNVNMLYTTRVIGVSRAESVALISYLSGLASVPEWQVRFHWAPGSVAVWDNRSVQHYAVNDYHPYPRLMHRVTVY